MNENDYNRRSDWYAAQQSTVYSGKRSGKHKTLKIVMICVCALLVLCAAVPCALPAPYAVLISACVYVAARVYAGPIPGAPAASIISAHV